MQVKVLWFLFVALDVSYSKKIPNKKPVQEKENVILTLDWHSLKWSNTKSVNCSSDKGCEVQVKACLYCDSKLPTCHIDPKNACIHSGPKILTKGNFLEVTGVEKYTLQSMFGQQIIAVSLISKDARYEIQVNTSGKNVQTPNFENIFDAKAPFTFNLFHPKKKPLLTGKSNGKKFSGEFSVSLSYNCTKNYFGDFCLTFCNDTAIGYSCNRTTGDRICKPNWYPLKQNAKDCTTIAKDGACTKQCDHSKPEVQNCSICGVVTCKLGYVPVDNPPYCQKDAGQGKTTKSHMTPGSGTSTTSEKSVITTATKSSIRTTTTTPFKNTTTSSTTTRTTKISTKGTTTLLSPTSQNGTMLTTTTTTTSTKPTTAKVTSVASTTTQKITTPTDPIKLTTALTTKPMPNVVTTATTINLDTKGKIAGIVISVIVLILVVGVLVGYKLYKIKNRIARRRQSEINMETWSPSVENPEYMEVGFRK